VAGRKEAPSKKKKTMVHMVKVAMDNDGSLLLIRGGGGGKKGLRFNSFAGEREKEKIVGSTFINLLSPDSLDRELKGEKERLKGKMGKRSNPSGKEHPRHGLPWEGRIIKGFPRGREGGVRQSTHILSSNRKRVSCRKE